MGPLKHEWDKYLEHGWKLQRENDQRILAERAARAAANAGKSTNVPPAKSVAPPEERPVLDLEKVLLEPPDPDVSDLGDGVSDCGGVETLEDAETLLQRQQQAFDDEDSCRFAG